MTEEQKAAYVNSQSICALIEAMGMTAENYQRVCRGESVAYIEADFVALIEKHGIHHNAVLTTFHG